MIINPYVFAGPSTTDIIQLLGNGTNGGTTFFDGGSAGSSWSNGGSAVETSTAQFVEGTASIHSTSAGAAIGTPYVPANAIETGDWFIGAYIQLVSGGASRYLIGANNAAGTAASDAWFLYSASGLQAYLFISDGTTVHNVTFGSWSGSWQYVRIERVSNTIYCSLDTAAPTTLAFTGTVNRPDIGTYAPDLRIGSGGAGNGPNEFYCDMFQVKRQTVYGGATIGALPTSPV